LSKKSIERRRIVAGGVGVVDSGVFQSFVVSLHANASKKNYFWVPRPIKQDLCLNEGDLLEIAVRRIPFSVARDAYGFVVAPHNVLCPICQSEGVFQRHAWNTYAIRHPLSKGSGAKFCTLSGIQVKEIITKYQENKLAKERS
jgi:hypothetical protein